MNLLPGLLAVLLAAGPDLTPAPSLTVTTSVVSPAQGGVSLVTVTSDRPLEALVMVDGEMRIALERNAFGTNSPSIRATSRCRLRSWTA